MKIYILKFFVFAAALSFLASCEDDAELTTLQEVNFTADPSVSPSSVTLTQESAGEDAVTISWPAVHYPVEAPVTYSLQFDVAADTIGDMGWENAISMDAGSDVLSKSLKGGDLNDMATDLGLEPDQEGTVLIRVLSDLDRTISSKVIPMHITPYTTVIPNSKIYLPGAYQGWDPATADSISATATSGVFQGILSLKDPEKLNFKVTVQKNWDENYGSDGNGNLVFDGPDLTVPAPGNYQITVDLNNLTWSAEPHTWGVIGPATPGGWDADTDMFYDSGEQVWKYVGALNAGALKWRLNDEWTVNYGPRNNEEGIAYLDDPGAHTVEQAGVYEVRFKVSAEDPSKANYSVMPISWGIVGDATAGGWDQSTAMDYNVDEGNWQITAELTPGAVKFRRDNQWTLNYGPRNNEDGILYLDDPGAHGVAEAGTYNITFSLDPESPQTAQYTIEKVN